MRDPKRIKQLLEAIEHLWNKAPDMRFSQIVNLIADQATHDFFYTEDNQVMDIIKQLEEKFK